MEEQVRAARDLMGTDFWSYGIPANRKSLEYFLARITSRGCRRGSSNQGPPDEFQVEASGF